MAMWLTNFFKINYYSPSHHDEELGLSDYGLMPGIRLCYPFRG